MVKSEEETWANKHCMAESPLDLFWIQNSGYFLDTKITIFLDFDLKFLILSGCPSGGVYSSRRSNLFPQWTSFFFPTRNTYFRVKRPKTIKKRSIICIFRPYLDDNRHCESYLGLKQSMSCLKQPKNLKFLPFKFVQNFWTILWMFGANVQNSGQIQKFCPTLYNLHITKRV